MPSDKVSILVVDDLPEKLLVMETILEDLGEDVVTARSGAEALQQVLRQDFAVILMDVEMPGMDGIETAALIRQRRKSAKTPIIFVTAFADDFRTSQGYSLGAVDYMLSPVVPEILRTKVKVFVDLHRMTLDVRRHAEERVALAREQAAREAAERAAAAIQASEERFRLVEIPVIENEKGQRHQRFLLRGPRHHGAKVGEKLRFSRVGVVEAAPGDGGALEFGDVPQRNAAGRLPELERALDARKRRQQVA